MRAPALGLARALALAGAAWLASDAPAPAGAFLATWTVAFAPPLTLLAVLEQPLWVGLGGRAAGAGAAAGALTSLLTLGGLAWLWSPLRSLGAWGPFLIAVAGAVVGGALPPQGERRRQWVAGGGGLLLLLAAMLAIVDPEGRYRARYAENRLTAADLAAPAPFAGRDPRTLSDLEVAQAVAHTWMRTHPVEELRWSWEEAVALEGLLAYGAASGDPAPREYARAWVAAQAEAGADEPLWADAAAPAATALAVVGAQHPTVRRVARYVRQAPRTDRGAISHTGLLLGGLLPPQAWVDSLFMHGVFLNRLQRAGETWAGEEAARLGRAAVDALVDPDAGLFRHAELELGPVVVHLPVERTFWARGNGWAAWFLVDVQLARRARGEAEDPVLRSALKRLARALVEAQDASGLWRTDLLGGPSGDNPLETSASALFVAALARARATGVVEDGGPLREALRRARTALRRQVVWERGHPVVKGTSTGTDPLWTAAYRAVAADDNVGHGVGALLLALSGPE